MFFRLFNWFVKRVPYTFAVMLPFIIWSVLSAAFGAILIYSRANFHAITGKAFICTITLSVGTVILLLCIEFGFLRVLGLKIEGKGLNVLNKNIVKGRIRPGLSGQTLTQIYDALEQLNRKLMNREVQYISAIVILCALVEGFVNGQIRNAFIILGGGLISFMICFICSVPFWGLLISPVRRECKFLLTSKNIHFKEPSFLSFRAKSRFFILLILLVSGVMLFLMQPFNYVLIIFTILILVIATFLSELVFRSIYQAFIEIKDSAAKLVQNKKVSFLTGSSDKEILDLSQILNKSAEEIYENRKKIEEQLNELQRWHKATIGRELKMIELKKEIEELKKEAKK